MRVLASIVLAALIGGMALAQEPDNTTIPGEVVVEPPTLNALGVEWRITGDANRNASVGLEYRKQGDAEWRRGAPLMRLNGE